MYYFSMCPVCGHSRYYELVCNTLVCVLFVATPTYTISVYYFSIMVAEKGHVTEKGCVAVKGHIQTIF